MIIREATLNDLDRCYEIESISYGDEGATKEKIKKRISTYPTGFVVLEINNNIVGFINSGATNNVVLSDEEFKELVGHDENGKDIVIMSVVVDSAFQKKGYAGKLLTHFISKMKNLDKSSIHLICLTKHLKLYEKYGFKYIKQSSFDHGDLAWNDMILRF